MNEHGTLILHQELCFALDLPLFIGSLQYQLKLGTVMFFCFHTQMIFGVVKYIV